MKGGRCEVLSVYKRLKTAIFYPNGFWFSEEMDFVLFFLYIIMLHITKNKWIFYRIRCSLQCDRSSARVARSGRRAARRPRHSFGLSKQTPLSLTAAKPAATLTFLWQILLKLAFINSFEYIPIQQDRYSRYFLIANTTVSRSYCFKTIIGMLNKSSWIRTLMKYFFVVLCRPNVPDNQRILR